MNQVFINGNLVADFQVLGEGKIGKFTIAHNDRRKNKDGNEQVETVFLDVIVLGEKRVKGLSKILKKGIPVIVSGKLRQNNWVDKNGNKKSKLELILNDLHFLSTKKNNQKGEEKQEEKNEDVPQKTETEDIPQVNIDDESIPF